MLSHCLFRPTSSASSHPSSIRLRCRDFTFVSFCFADNEVARDAFDFIRARTCRLGTVEKLFAFNHRPLKQESQVDGWNLYDVKAEFRRQGISEKLPDKGWRITKINNDYAFCDTYPSLLVVPSKISDNVLKYAGDFRSRSRIPVLSYLHPVNNCTITRSSQPLAGITRRSNVQDETLVAASFSSWSPGGNDEIASSLGQPFGGNGGAVLDSESMGSGHYEDELVSRSAAIYDEKTGSRLVYGCQQTNLIVDARPTINAMVNQVQGMGSENMDRYPFARKCFLSIENIHVVRNSLHKVVDVLKDSDLSPLPPSRDALQQSGWLRHIHSILDGASMIARRVGIRHSHVLIHCSDGWDRTSQLSALAQAMLDPYYRTLDGFIVLVEKDWLSFGHMFRLRSGHLNHEDWFVIQQDSLAGGRAHASDYDGRNDAIQNVINGARRFFNQTRDEADPSAISEAASGKVVDDEATTPKMVSPIFHQFLDCTYQLLRQYPNRFEFNERFLRRLLYHLYSCQYGTFLYNSEKQRHDARVSERTSSVWDYFLCRRHEFTNPDYDSVIDDRERGRERILLPDLDDIRWWHQFFGRTDDEMNGGFKAAAGAQRGPRLPSSSSNQAESARCEIESAARSATASPRVSGPKADSGSLTDNVRDVDSEGAGPVSARRSASLERSSPFSAIRDGIAGLSIGRGAVSVTAKSDEAAATPPDGDQELQEMA